ncbi:MAG: DUF2029 domain-containing protein [Gemmataceae bacterium]|nr:DUF2029 domain-containing protein [Gemmataceae bacterium]
MPKTDSTDIWGVHSPVVQWLAVVCLVGWIGYAALGKTVFGQTRWPDGMVDYRLIYDFSHSIVTTKTYSAKHSYPPPAIAFHYATAQWSYPVAAGVYLALNIVATLGCCAILASLIRPGGKVGTGVAVLLAFVAAAQAFTWELRSQNCNAFFLLALLGAVWCLDRGHTAPAGLLLAFSFSLKLFSVLVIPYLLWRREGRAFAWTLVGIALFWVAVPLALFGAEGIGPVYASWWNQIASASRGQADLTHPILISLHNAAHVLTGGSEAGIAAIIRSTQIIWVMVGLTAMWLAVRRDNSEATALGWLTDVGLLTLGPLATSPYLEVYHLVGLMCPAAVLTHVAADGRQSRRLRLTAAIAFWAAIALAAAPTPWRYRGAWTNAQLLLITTGAVAVCGLRRPTRVIEEAVDLRQAA